MPAPLNYNIYLIDAGVGGGAGPYTVTVQKNPTTLASGGTTLVTESNSVGNLNPVELVSIAQGWVSDNISTAIQTDTAN